MESPPLGWVIDTDGLSGESVPVAFNATGEELVLLARYLEVDAVTSFSANGRVVPLGGGKFRLGGSFEATMVQPSVVNLEPVVSSIAEGFAVEYWPAAAFPAPSGEAAPLDLETPEVLQNGAIPVGALLCELLSVSVDPYPRKEGETFEWPREKSETGTSPFSALARLKGTRRDGEPE